MCGIVGYVGSANATDILIDGLRKLEYRGYDSAGIAVLSDGEVKVCKAKGRLDDVEEKMAKSERPCGHLGIGHTRWATHGEPNDVNSHPHCSNRVVVVHNGIIENYLELKEKLISLGYTFASETDTETIAHLLDYNYKNDPIDALKKTVKELRGSFAIGAIFEGYNDTVFAARKESPLIVGVGEGENYIASDIPAILKYTRNYYLIETGEIVEVTRENVKVMTFDGTPVAKEVQTVTWDIEAAEKGGYEHFMLKEMHEEPKALRDTISPRIVDGKIDLGIENLTDEDLKKFNKIWIVACGTAMHAGIVGKTAIETLSRVPVEVDIASEFRYRNPVIRPDDLVIIISQSGETADTLAALRLSKEAGAKVLAIVNVVGSSIAREADSVLYTWAGPEIAVASTKAYSVQVSVMYLLAIKLAEIHGKITQGEIEKMTKELLSIPEVIEELLERKDEFKAYAETLKNIENMFYIGRGLDYALAQEGSLKIKEISYIHSEAYAAGELKHGTISLITEGTPVIGIATQTALYEKTMSNVKEVTSRGGEVMILCHKGDENAKAFGKYIIELPSVMDMFMPIPAILVLQMIAYYASIARGCDVDKPRNLAKSVTVE